MFTQTGYQCWCLTGAHVLLQQQFATRQGSPSQSVRGQHLMLTVLCQLHLAGLFVTFPTQLIAANLSVGKGEMMWRLFCCFPIVDCNGPEIDQSALVRYLSEACYYPTALLPSHRLTWSAIDDHHAKATLRHGPHKVSGVFEFDDEGRMVSMQSSDRYRYVCGAVCQ